MDRLLKILIEHPYLILILAAWIGGAIANAAKAAKKARERTEAQRRISPPARSAPATPGQRSADEIAEEMRRILGMEEPVRRTRPAPARGRAEVPAPAPKPARALPRPLRDVPTPERPPAPVMPSTQARALEIHVDPHVGDAIKGRQLPEGARARKADLGTLGGRVHSGTARRVAGSRYALDDLKRAFVLAEVLGPPLALRAPDALRGV